MTKSIPWDLYRSFLSVLNAGSLSGAARALGLTQPTIGRHVSELESGLGVPLFTRSQAGLQATEAALQLRNQLEEMQNIAAAIERSAQGHGEVRGAVRISASDVVGVEILPAILAPLRLAYPGLAVELVLSDSVQDLVGREVDIAVRMTEPQQDVLVAQRVSEVKLGLFAHKGYLARHGMPARVADLANHSLIGFDTDSVFLRAAQARIRGMESRKFRISMRQQPGPDGADSRRGGNWRVPGRIGVEGREPGPDTATRLKPGIDHMGCHARRPAKQCALPDCV